MFTNDKLCGIIFFKERRNIIVMLGDKMKKELQIGLCSLIRVEKKEMQGLKIEDVTKKISEIVFLDLFDVFEYETYYDFEVKEKYFNGETIEKFLKEQMPMYRSVTDSDLIYFDLIKNLKTKENLLTSFCESEFSYYMSEITDTLILDDRKINLYCDLCCFVPLIFLDVTDEKFFVTYLENLIKASVSDTNIKSLIKIRIK